jgi:hypothetical protein
MDELAPYQLTREEIIAKFEANARAFAEGQKRIPGRMSFVAPKRKPSSSAPMRRLMSSCGSSSPREKPAIRG